MVRTQIKLLVLIKYSKVVWGSRRNIVPNKQQKKQAKETTEYRKEQLAIKKREVTVLEGQEKAKVNEQKYIDYQRYEELKNTGMPLERIKILFPHMAIFLKNNTITKKDNSISNK